ATDVDAFRARLASRREIGRAVLALSRATHPAIIERQIERITDLVPGDEVIANELRSIRQNRGTQEGDDTRRRSATTVRVQLTETYRVHRRLLRTRRSVLMEQGELVQQRTERPPEYEAPADPQEDAEDVEELWHRLEEWRVQDRKSTRLNS